MRNLQKIKYIYSDNIIKLNNNYYPKLIDSGDFNSDIVYTLVNNLDLLIICPASKTDNNLFNVYTIKKEFFVNLATFPIHVYSICPIHKETYTYNSETDYIFDTVTINNNEITVIQKNINTSETISNIYTFEFNEDLYNELTYKISDNKLTLDINHIIINQYIEKVNKEFNMFQIFKMLDFNNDGHFTQKDVQEFINIAMLGGSDIQILKSFVKYIGVNDDIWIIPPENRNLETLSTIINFLNINNFIFEFKEQITVIH